MLLNKTGSNYSSRFSPFFLDNFLFFYIICNTEKEGGKSMTEKPAITYIKDEKEETICNFKCFFHPGIDIFHMKRPNILFNNRIISWDDKTSKMKVEKEVELLHFKNFHFHDNFIISLLDKQTNLILDHCLFDRSISLWENDHQGSISIINPSFIEQFSSIVLHGIHDVDLIINKKSLVVNSND